MCGMCVVFGCGNLSPGGFRLCSMFYVTLCWESISGVRYFCTVGNTGLQCAVSVGGCQMGSGGGKVSLFT